MLKGLRLKLQRQPDPVLQDDHLWFVEDRATRYLEWADQQMSQGLVSESVIRNRQTALEVQTMVRQVLMSMRPGEHMYWM